MTLAGFMSRWTMPLSCAASSPSTIYLAGNRQGVVPPHRAARQLRGQRLALDVLEDEIALRSGAINGRRVEQLVNARDVRVAQRGERLRLPLEPSQSLGICGELGRQGLDGDIALQLRIAGAKDLSHAARPERRQDLERAEPCAGFHDGPMIVHDAGGQPSIRL
jgi:hypothetical protein